MSRCRRFPVLSLSLLVLWLLLTQTLAAGHVLLGAVLAVGGSLALARLDVPGLRLRRPLAALSLSLAVLRDILRSNAAVAQLILRPHMPRATSGFLNIPLDMRAPYGLAALAIIITSTPGTLWVGFDASNGLLTIHVLDLIDEDAWIATIKQRYERRLMEIFE